ncbi:alpha/beta-hydrolase superfamily protein [Forsythia ovata]|uniref:Alpha/beta-hydrolase superfamily protein n=1 Tax=Forsythia ovata TaxID=205694 RepID=A0ABD1S3L0_9LAMI
MVLDIPFSDLVDLMMELVDTNKFRLLKLTVAKSCFVPVLIGHAVDDDFIQPRHSDLIFDHYMLTDLHGDKNIIKFKGDHNSLRPKFYFDSISIFFNNVLQPPEYELRSTLFDLSPKYFGELLDTSDKKRISTLRAPPRSSLLRLLGALNQAEDLHPEAPTLPMTKFAPFWYRGGGPVSKWKPSPQRGCMGHIPYRIWVLEIEGPERALFSSLTRVLEDLSSKDKQLDAQEQGTGYGSGASSSTMINFELSSGSPSGDHTPASIDDDKYVEYHLDNAADFSSNAEKEERMFKNLKQDNSSSTKGNLFETNTSAAKDRDLVSQNPIPDTSKSPLEHTPKSSPPSGTSTCKHSSSCAGFVYNSKVPITSAKNVAASQ